MVPSRPISGVHSNISKGEIAVRSPPSAFMVCSVYTATGRSGPPPQRT
jgi:hypothetical protein